MPEVKLTPKARVVEDANGEILVETTWSAEFAVLDTPNGLGYLVGKRSPRVLKLAARLANAIDAGVVFPKPELLRLPSGRTLVSHGHVVRGRCMSADLRALGF